jgi:methylated-DNA-protein-cysteine methyltransferase related protein
MSKFKEGVIRAVSLIPYGKVASYGQIAFLIGMPRAARQVGWILNGLSDVSVPWWRVVNNKGIISIKGSSFSADDQKALLISEGVDVKDLTFDIKKYRWNPDEKVFKKLNLSPDYLDSIAEKIYFSKQK